jgi:hypothetical protein
VNFVNVLQGLKVLLTFVTSNWLTRYFASSVFFRCHILARHVRFQRKRLHLERLHLERLHLDTDTYYAETSDDDTEDELAVCRDQTQLAFCSKRR